MYALLHYNRNTHKIKHKEQWKIYKILIMPKSKSGFVRHRSKHGFLIHTLMGQPIDKTTEQTGSKPRE